MKSPPRVVCFLAAPRTGSTQLGRVVASFDRVDSYGEIFHPHGAYSLRRRLARLSERCDVSLPDNVHDQATIDFVRAHPDDVLETMLEAAGPDQAVSFNAFHFHLKPAVLKATVLERDDVLPIVLQRRVIDSHVSDLKAGHNRLWRDQDTTNLAVEVNIDGFEEWLERLHRWYKWCDQTLTNLALPRHILTYESDIEPGEERTAEALADIFAAHDLLVDRDLGSIKSMKKQDRSTDLSDKVSNWSEFETELHQRGLYDLAMGYFI